MCNNVPNVNFGQPPTTNQETITIHVRLREKWKGLPLRIVEMERVTSRLINMERLTSRLISDGNSVWQELYLDLCFQYKGWLGASFSRVQPMR